MTGATIHRATDPTCPATRTGVSAALATLGDTPDRVAKILADGGHLGEPGEDTYCPVAAYLHTAIPSITEYAIAVTGTTVIAHRSAGRVEADLPDPVRRFVAAFDLGAFRFLRTAGDIDPDDPDRANADT